MQTWPCGALAPLLRFVWVGAPCTLSRKNSCGSHMSAEVTCSQGGRVETRQTQTAMLSCRRSWVFAEWKCFLCDERAHTHTHTHGRQSDNRWWKTWPQADRFIIKTAHTLNDFSDKMAGGEDTALFSVFPFDIGQSITRCRVGCITVRLLYFFKKSWLKLLKTKFCSITFTCLDFSRWYLFKSYFFMFSLVLLLKTRRNAMIDSWPDRDWVGGNKRQRLHFLVTFGTTPNDILT